ncbi:MAG: hypothetical protein ACK55I_29190, partial [bacterium]
MRTDEVKGQLQVVDLGRHQQAISRRGASGHRERKRLLQYEFEQQHRHSQVAVLKTPMRNQTHHLRQPLGRRIAAFVQSIPLYPKKLPRFQY